MFIKWTVVQNVNMMSEHNMSLCHNATFLFMYQMESCSNLTTWQLDNLTTWQPDNTLTVYRVCLSFRHFCTLNANPYTQYHDYSDNYLDVYSDNYLDDYSDNYLDDYCYDYREACTLNLIHQFHLWKQSVPCYPVYRRNIIFSVENILQFLIKELPHIMGFIEAAKYRRV